MVDMTDTTSCAHVPVRRYQPTAFQTCATECAIDMGLYMCVHRNVQTCVETCGVPLLLAEHIFVKHENDPLSPCHTGSGGSGGGVCASREEEGVG